MICLLRYGGGCRFDKPVRTLAQCTARVQESCAHLLHRKYSHNALCLHLKEGNNWPYNFPLQTNDINILLLLF
jgi:hypothetical protein